MVIVMLFSSCGKVKPQAVTEKMSEYFNNNDYNGCKSYLSTIDASIKSQASVDALNLVINEFKEMSSKNNNSDLLDLTSVNDTFVKNCVTLWGIASEFTPTEDIKFNEDLQKLRYYYELSDSLRYKELFKMLKDMYKNGYFYTIHKALNDYDVLGEYSEFENLEKIAENFKYTEYNPQEYYIHELRDACENMIQYLKSINNGFATNDSSVTATAMNNIYRMADIFLYACNTANSVYNNMNDALNCFKLNGAFAEYKNKEMSNQSEKYSSGTEFPLYSIFGEGYTPNTNTEENEETNTGTVTVSKSEAIRIAENALNKSKAYNGDLTLVLTQTVNVQMTSFKTESDITSAVSLVKIRINDALNASNGTSKREMNFKDGMFEGVSLYDTLPPSGKSASIDPSLVDSYTAVKGTGGYVITFNLRPCNSVSEDGSYNKLLSIVDGFYFDKENTNINHNTYYAPTSITIIVSNTGYVSRYSYSISGVADCKFYEEGEQVATSEFSFKNQYTYDFTY